MTDGRSIDHQGLEVLSTDECWDLVRETPVGRIAFVESGLPTILPVNHGLLGHRVVIRTAGGALLNEALLNKPVAFEVDGFDEAARTGWSVLVRGMAEPLRTDVDLDELGLDAWADAISRDDAVVLMVEEISGRRIVRETS
jgi:nitroimidazol reductase NimA-like FMN-containing flavoprotein (pyridoxamine 5'-phosphate oxidase superfamily)